MTMPNEAASALPLEYKFAGDHVRNSLTITTLAKGGEKNTLNRGKDGAPTDEVELPVSHTKLDIKKLLLIIVWFMGVGAVITGFTGSGSLQPSSASMLSIIGFAIIALVSNIANHIDE